MKKYLSKPATSALFNLAEGPVWDYRTNELLWVDIVNGTVFVGHFEEGRVHISKSYDFETMVGAVALGQDGSLLVAAQESLVKILLDGTRVIGPRIVPQGVKSRSNDGKVDPQGRFLIGTLALDDRQGQERLMRLELDNTITVIDSDVVLSNGMAWSSDGTKFFNIDSGKQIIWVRDYFSDMAVPGNKRVFAQISDGYPDGMTIDSQGNLWVAIWGKAEIRVFNSDGEVISSVNTSAPHTSSVTFVGPELKQLVITTATVELTEDALNIAPDSGSLFFCATESVGTLTDLWTPTF